MEIPRPRLKALLELDSEEKVAEKAIVAIRRKSLVLDTEMERIRDEVEGEMEKLEAQRNYLENSMQQIIEDQNFLTKALMELEGRQTTHKRNLSMLKGEEEEIERERREINAAFKELRSAQRSLKDTINKKYFQGGPISPSRFSKAFEYASPFRERQMEITPPASYEPHSQEWPAMQMQQKEEREPEVKVISRMKPGVYASSGSDADALQPVAEKEKIDDLAIEMPMPKPATARKPGILKRIRLAADKFLPQPLRINKPPIAMLEERVDEAESTELIETASAKSVAVPAEAEKLPDSKPEEMPAGMEAESAVSTPPSVDQEITRFEEKINRIEGKPQEMQAQDDFRSRISRIVASKKPSLAVSEVPIESHTPRDAIETQKANDKLEPIQSEGVLQKASTFSKPIKAIEHLLPSDTPSGLEKPLQSPIAQRAAPESEKRPVSLKKPQSKSMEIPGDKSFVIVRPGEPMVKNEETGENLRPSPPYDAKQHTSSALPKMSTEEKLQRLHAKLQEMKSALRQLNSDEATVAPTTKKTPPRKDIHEKVKAVSKKLEAKEPAKKIAAAMKKAPAMLKSKPTKTGRKR